MFLSASKKYLELIAKFLILILPVCLFTGNAVVEIIVGTVGVFFLIHSAISRNWSWTKEGWVRAAFLLWAYFVVVSFFADDIILSLKRGAPWIRFIVFACAIAYWITKDKQFVQRFKYALGITAVFISLNAIFQYIAGYDFLGREYYNNGNYIRLLSFNGKMYIGNLLSLLSLPSIAIYYENRKKLGVFFPVLALLPVIGVFLSGERMAFIIILTCLFAFVILQKELRAKALLAGGVILILAAPIMYMNHTQFARQYSALYELKNTDSTYQRIYHVAFDLFKANPVFGIGLKHYQQKCNNSSYNPEWLVGGAPKEYYCQTHPHNIFIEIATETGLVGFVMFLTLITMWLRAFWSGRAIVLKDTFTLACMITCLVKYVPVFASSSYFVAWPFASTWLFLGFALSRLKR